MTKSAARLHSFVFPAIDLLAFRLWFAKHDDHIDPLDDKLLDERWEPVGASIGLSEEHAAIATIFPTKVLQWAEKAIRERGGRR